MEMEDIEEDPLEREIRREAWLTPSTREDCRRPFIFREGEDVLCEYGSLRL